MVAASDNRHVLFVESDDFSTVHILVVDHEDWDVAQCGETLPWGAIEVYRREGRKPFEPVMIGSLCVDCVVNLGTDLKR
jgi:hypothetical protein